MHFSRPRDNNNKKQEENQAFTKYCDVLENHFLPILKANFNNYWLQQDNTNSQDLSQIEKVWSIIKARFFSTKKKLWTKIQGEIICGLNT